MLEQIVSLRNELELQKPENSAAVKAYIAEDVRRVDEAVYQPLLNKYPSLADVVKLVKESKKDPVKSMTGQRAVDNYATLLKVLSTVVRLSDEGKRPSEEMGYVADKIQPLRDIQHKFIPIKSEFYMGIAKAVREIAEQTGQTFEQVVQDPDHYDSVTRKAWPTREEADAYLNLNLEIHERVLGLLGDLQKYMKKAGGAIAEKFLKELATVPTPKAMQAYKAALIQHDEQELDRVYGSRVRI